MKAAKKNQPWTPEEDAALAIAWADVTLSTAAIATAMQRTTASLYPRAALLSLPSRPLGVPTANSSFWTSERLKVLRDEFDAGTGFSAIGRKLGCTKNMALGKCNRMGWTRAAPAWMPREARTERGLQAAANGHRISRLTNSVPRPKPRLTVVGNNTVIEHVQRPARTITKDKAWAPLPGSTPRPFWERTLVSCNWPLDIEGQEPGVMRCCLPTVRGSYCVDHGDLAYAAPKPPTQRATNELLRANRRFYA